MEHNFSSNFRADVDAVAVVPGLTPVTTDPRDLALGPLAKVGPHGAGPDLGRLLGSVAVALARLRLTPGHLGSDASLLVTISALVSSKRL